MIPNHQDGQYIHSFVPRLTLFDHNLDSNGNHQHWKIPSFWRAFTKWHLWDVKQLRTEPSGNLSPHQAVNQKENNSDPPAKRSTSIIVFVN